MFHCKAKLQDQVYLGISNSIVKARRDAIEACAMHNKIGLLEAEALLKQSGLITVQIIL